MKTLTYILFLTIFSVELSSQIIWDGPIIEFTKEDFADWTLAENQDRITDSVWITRRDVQSFFNAAKEDQHNLISPVGTEWSYGNTAEINSLTFNSWKNTTGSPMSAIGNEMVLHLIEEDIYIDFMLLSFSGGGPGGGFIYQRSTPAPNTVECDVWSGPTLEVVKDDFADWTLSENQDRIADSVWITRADTKSIFNAATEDEYAEDFSPEGTQWAIGTTDGVELLDFAPWEIATGSPNSVINTPMVLHLIDENICVDFVLKSWSGGGPGGGFSYERSSDQTINSTTDIVFKNNLKIYPNPTQDVIRITLTADNKVIDYLEILSLDGQFVRRIKQPNLNSINVSDLLPGKYIIKLSNSQVGTFIKL